MGEEVSELGRFSDPGLFILVSVADDEKHCSRWPSTRTSSARRAVAYPWWLAAVLAALAIVVVSAATVV